MAGLEGFKRTFTIIIIIIIKDWTMLAHSSQRQPLLEGKRVKAVVTFCSIMARNKINRAYHRNRFANFSILD